MKKLIEKDRNLFFVISLCAFAVVYFLLHRKAEGLKSQTSVNSSPVKEIPSADTYIPAGYVLVPLQIENTTAVTGLVQNFAVVDLYNSAKEASEYELILPRVKLLRAPLDPSQFAVLVTDAQAQTLLSSEKPFRVVLQNRSVLNAKTEVLALNESPLPIRKNRKMKNKTENIIKVRASHERQNKKQPTATQLQAPRVRIEYQL